MEKLNLKAVHLVKVQYAHKTRINSHLMFTFQYEKGLIHTFHKVEEWGGDNYMRGIDQMDNDDRVVKLLSDNFVNITEAVHRQVYLRDMIYCAN